MFGPRIANIQARWALAAITGRTTWPRTLRVPTELRNRLCNDLGWPCLWIEAKTSAIALFEKCRNDNHAFAHTRLCAEQPYASGGWLAAANRLTTQHNLPAWAPEPDSPATALKHSLSRHRREVIKPALLAASGSMPENPSLPWAWIAIHAGGILPQSAFELWWQIRSLGQPYPPVACPWCQPAVALTREHLQTMCAHYAYHCWTLGILPAEAFSYPAHPDWFKATLRATHAVAVDLGR